MAKFDSSARHVRWCGCMDIIFFIKDMSNEGGYVVESNEKGDKEQGLGNFTGGSTRAHWKAWLRPYTL